MIRIPLRAGPLWADGYVVQRSGFRWLREEGQVCRPGEVIAWCTIGLVRKAGLSTRPTPFREEPYDFQVAVASRVGGRLRRADAASKGGFLDLLQYFRTWDGDEPI